MIRFGVTLRSLTLPEGLSESLLVKDVRHALKQFNAALEGIVEFRVEQWPESDYRVFIEFGKADEGTAELVKDANGKDFTVKLDPRADWDLKKRWFMRFGAVSTLTLIMHELAHIAQFAHEAGEDSILYARPFPRRHLTREDAVMLRLIFRQWAAQQGREDMSIQNSNGNEAGRLV